MTRYRNKGTIYKSYLETIDTIKSRKEKYFYLKSVMELSLFGEKISENLQENLKNYDEFSKKILENLDKNKMFFSKIALMNLIPNAKNSYKGWLNGEKGKEYGILGGAPLGNQNARKNNPETTPDIEEEKDIEKEKKNKIENIEEDISEENNTPSRSPKGESGVMYIPNSTNLKRYGYNGHVVLTEQNIVTLRAYFYQQLSRYIHIDENTAFKGLQVIIDELDRNIEKGKENEFTSESNPIEHYQLLQRYIQQKLKTENINDFVDSLM